MNFSEEISDQIDQYLDDQMSVTERTAFEQKIANNSQLKILVDLQSEIVSGIRKTAHSDFKKRLDGIHKKHIDTEKKLENIHRNRFRWRYFSVAASAAILIIAGWFIFNFEDKDEEMFAVPNRRPLLVEKYSVASPDNQLINVIVFDWEKTSLKYNFQNERFVLMIPEGTKLNKTELKFFKKKRDDLYLKYNEKLIRVETSNKLIDIKDE